MTWVLPYLDKPWTEQTDCYHWFARIQREVFGRAAPLLADADYRHEWRVTGTPRDGDAVIMHSNARDVRLHHIGVWHNADGGGVVHAQRGGRVCFDSLPSLQQQQWTIREILTPCQ